jgi:DNA (cytosine-5)-methyltransferase 1
VLQKLYQKAIIMSVSQCVTVPEEMNDLTLMLDNVPKSYVAPHILWKVVDLFSGCGGMSEGFRAHRDYFEIVGAVDLEVAKPGRGKHKASSTRCNSTYYRNIGIEPKSADLLRLDPRAYREELRLEKGELTVLIACPPCTGFSQKNAKNHLSDDPRNKLVVRTSDFVEEFLPEFFVMENVKELLKGKQQHHFQTLYSRLHDLGYSIYADIHELSDYGLPQRRERALIIARRDHGFIGSCPLKRQAEKITVWQAIAHLPQTSAGQEHACDPMHVSPGMTSVVLSRIQAIPKDGGSWGDIMKNPKVSDEEKQKLLIPSMFRARPGSFPDVYGRLKWHDVAATITRECGHVGNGRYAHPEQDRLLTVREMAILQGFPSHYFFDGALASKYNQIGDAVPPLISHQIAQHIISLNSNQSLNIGPFQQHTKATRQLELLKFC